MISDAGPPVESAAPEVTKRPVPAGAVSILYITSRQRGKEEKLTNRTTDCDHLHVATFQLVSKPRVCGCLSSSLVVVPSLDNLLLGRFGDLGIWVASEAVDEPRGPWPLVFGAEIDVGIPIRWRRAGACLLDVSVRRTGRHDVVECTLFIYICMCVYMKRCWTTKRDLKAFLLSALDEL
jgi:hypothetical protein